MTRTSNLASKYTTWGLLATMAATVTAPVLADPASQQKNKNQWRNLGIAGAAIAGYGLLKGDKTATLLGAAGAAYSANRYETDRHHQSQNNSNRYDYRRYHRADNNGGYSNGGGYYDNSGSYNNNGGRWRNDNNNGGYSNSGYNNGYGDNNSDENSYVRHDNGRHRGWAKHHDRDDNKDKD